MEKKQKTTSFCFTFLLLVLFLLSPRGSGSNASSKVDSGKNEKKMLFVFGDSYADTGNWKRGTGVAWRLPYGSTFPGKPTGRFSDGRILTDFIASYLGVTSPPVPYEQRRTQGAARKLKFGMNFAYGGTGVFDTGVSQPNMTTQIDFFQNVLKSERTYTKDDLETSIALVTLGGNDYANLFRGGSQQDIQGFTTSIVNQLVSNLDRIHSLGVQKIAVTGLEPLGCLPAITGSSSYRNCSDNINAIAGSHNRLLEQKLGDMNKQIRQSPAFFVLDLYTAFMSGLKTPPYELQRERSTPLEPCCRGVTGDFGCGSTQGNDTKYSICEDPGAAFFWDTVHPAQNGWYRVFLSLRASLSLLK